MPEYTGDLHALIGDAGSGADWFISAYPQGAIDGAEILVTGPIIFGTSADDGTFAAELGETPPDTAAYYALQVDGQRSWKFQTFAADGLSTIGESITAFYARHPDGRATVTHVPTPGRDGDPGPRGLPGEGVHAGGSTGQFLAKTSDDDYDTEWLDVSGGVDPEARAAAAAAQGTADTAQGAAAGAVAVNVTQGRDITAHTAALAAAGTALTGLQMSDSEQDTLLEGLRTNVDQNARGATTTRAGLIESATGAEIRAGTAGELAVTAQRLLSNLTLLLNSSEAGGLVSSVTVAGSVLTVNFRGGAQSTYALPSGGGGTSDGVISDLQFDLSGTQLILTARRTIGDDVVSNTITLPAGGGTGDDAYDWATVGHDDELVPTAKVNLAGIQTQLDEIVDQLAHASGPTTAVAGVLGSGNDSLRYTLANTTAGSFDLSVVVTARVQVNDFVSFSGVLQIIEDGGGGLNVLIPEVAHNFQHHHEATFTFVRRGLEIPENNKDLTFRALVTGQNPPDVHFIDVAPMKLTPTSLVNSTNVGEFVADFAEAGKPDVPVPDDKLTGVHEWALDSNPIDATGTTPRAQELGRFPQADIDAIPLDGEQEFEYRTTVQKAQDSTLAYIGGSWRTVGAGSADGVVDELRVLVSGGLLQVVAGRTIGGDVASNAAILPAGGGGIPANDVEPFAKTTIPDALIPPSRLTPPAPVQETVTLVTAEISVASAIAVPSNVAMDILVQFRSAAGRYASDTVPTSWLNTSVAGTNISGSAIPLNLSQDRRLYLARDSDNNLLISCNNTTDVGAGTLRVTPIAVTAP